MSEENGRRVWALRCVSFDLGWLTDLGCLGVRVRGILAWRHGIRCCRVCSAFVADL
jgi:hypothetical protein